MWGFIKFLLGCAVLIILLGWFVTYIGNYNECRSEGGIYNLTPSGFKCEGRDK